MEEIILENKPKLIKWLSSDSELLLQHVQAKKLITMSQYNELMDMKPKERVIIKLLDIILSKGENVCREFLDLLKEDDVNEISPELRDWIKTVDTEYQKTEEDCKRRESGDRPIQETANMASHSCIKVKCNISSSDGSSIFSPVITGRSLCPIEFNTAAPSGRSDVQANYQKPDRDGQQRPIQDCQMFLKKNFSLLVQKVRNINPIIDDLDLHPESVANVRAKSTDQEKMRTLLGCVNCESIAKDLVTALYKHEKPLMNELQNNY
uniref:Si:dkey-10c21.1 n=1 Tax=Cyprinus carpio TaxID=7962 RepID=A0A8C1W421_CYPCA